MASSYTTLLKFNKPALGDAGWGTSVNGGFTDMVEQSLTGAVSVAVTSGGTTIVPAISDGVSSDARNQFLTITGTLTSVQTATVQLPVGTSTNFKLYFVKNSAGGTVTVTTATGTSVAVPDGASMVLRVTNAGVEVTMTHAVSLTLGTALGATSGGTGQSSYAVGDLLYASSTTALSKLAVGANNAVLTVAAGIPSWAATLPVASGGTGQTTAATAFDALKQSATTSYVGAVQLATTAEVQTGTDSAKPITPNTLRGGALVRDTAQNTTSGSLIEFSSIPSWVKRITVMFNGISTTGTNGCLLQLATGGTYATSGYLSYNASINGGTGQTDSTSGFIINPSGLLASAAITGQLVLVNLTGNLWVAAGSALYTQGAGAMVMYAGSVTLGGTLDRVRINSLTDTFDAGSVNIIYE